MICWDTVLVETSVTEGRTYLILFEKNFESMIEYFLSLDRDSSSSSGSVIGPEA